MAFICEDLAQNGVILVPPSTPEYFELLAGIERTLRTRTSGSPPLQENALSRVSEHDGKSAILLNRANVAIASVAYIWYFPGRNGRTIPHSRLPGTNASVLLPFGLDDRSKKFDAFWHTIFPGSKRLMMADGPFFGDNTDVRPPAADELWHGGFIMIGGGDLTPEEPLRLTLDGVFFVDGGFAGPNRLGSWEQTVSAAEAGLACAASAQEAHRNSQPASDFFLHIKQFTGQTDERRLPPPPPPSFGSGPPDLEPIRQRERQMVGWRVLSLRTTLGDDATIAAVAAWADAAVPKFHKLI